MQKDLVTLICLQRIKGRKINYKNQGKKVLCRPIDLDTLSMVTAMQCLTASTRYVCVAKVDLVVYKVKV